MHQFTEEFVDNAGASYNEQVEVEDLRVAKGISSHQAPDRGDNDEVLYWYDSSPLNGLDNLKVYVRDVDSGVLGKRRQLENTSDPNLTCPRLQSITSGQQNAPRGQDCELHKRQRLSSVDWPMATNDETSHTIENRDWSNVIIKEEIFPPVVEEAEF